MRSMNEFCKGLPKIELHAHLSGSVSDVTALQQIEKKGIQQLESGGKEDLSTLSLSCLKNITTLEECFERFALYHKLFDNLDDLYENTKSVISEFYSDGVIYLELRTTPRELSGASKEDYVVKVLQAIHDHKGTAGGTCDTRLLITIDRGNLAPGAAMTTVELAAKLRQTELGRDVIVGLDFSGNPCSGKADDFIPALKFARESGFKVALHLSEVAGRNDESLAFLQLPPDRIGHATFLHPAVGGCQQAVDLVVQKEIPVEICLSSNLICGTVASYDQHHLKFWIDKGHKITLCTDDKGIFHSDLSNEYAVAQQTFSLSEEDLYRMSLNSVDHAFCEEDVKKTLRENICNWWISYTSSI